MGSRLLKWQVRNVVDCFTLGSVDLNEEIEQFYTVQELFKHTAHWLIETSQVENQTLFRSLYQLNLQYVVPRSF